MASELLVSAVLLLSLISLVAPLAVRSGRFWQETRAYKLALEELTNELEYLTALPTAERQTSLEQWQPSEDLLAVLPGARLSGQTLDDEHGERLVLRLQWERQWHAQPLTLVGWIVPDQN